MSEWEFLCAHIKTIVCAPGACAVRLHDDRVFTGNTIAEAVAKAMQAQAAVLAEKSATTARRESEGI